MAGERLVCRLWVNQYEDLAALVSPSVRYAPENDLIISSQRNDAQGPKAEVPRTSIIACNLRWRDERNRLRLARVRFGQDRGA